MTFVSLIQSSLDLTMGPCPLPTRNGGGEANLGVKPTDLWECRPMVDAHRQAAVPVQGDLLGRERARFAAMMSATCDVAASRGARPRGQWYCSPCRGPA